MLNGAVEVAPGVKHVGQIILSAGHLRIEPHRLLILGNRTAEIPVVLQRQSQIIVRIGVVGPQGNSSFEFRNGFGIALAIQINAPQVVVRLKIIGIELDRLFVLGDGVFSVTFALEDGAFMEMALRFLGNNLLWRRSRSGRCGR